MVIKKALLILILLFTAVQTQAALVPPFYFDGTNIITRDASWPLRVPVLSSCDVIETDGNGVFSCGTDDGGYASTTIMDYIGSPTYTTVQDWSDTTQSAGKISGGAITDSGSGQVDVAAGTGFIKKTDSATGENVFFDWPQFTNVDIATNDTTYLYIDYNGGSPAVGTTTSQGTIHFTDQIGIGRAYYDGTTMHPLAGGVQIQDIPYRIHKRLNAVDGFIRATGLATSEIGTRSLAITAGTSWTGITEFSHSATSSPEFTYWYNDGAWQSATTTQISNTQYNNYSTGLATVTPNQYGIHRVYLHHDGDIHVVYGTESYTLAEAVEKNRSYNVPDIVGDFSLYIAKVIIKRDEATTFTDVIYPWDESVNGSGISSHLGLADLQGGTTDEYYHLTSSEYTELNGWLDDVTLGADGSLTLPTTLNVGTDGVTGDRTQTIWSENGYEGNLKFMETSVYGMGIRYNATENVLYWDRYVNSATPSGSNMSYRSDGETRFEGNTLVVEPSSSRVGIDTIAPDAKLHIQGDDSDGEYMLHLDGANAANLHGLLIDNDGEASDIAFRIRTSTSGGASTTDASTKFIVEGDGQVGIGLGATLPTHTLDVSGTLRATGATTIGGDLLVDSDVLSVDVSSDRVGIGIAVPEAQLHVRYNGTGNMILECENEGGSQDYYARLGYNNYGFYWKYVGSQSGNDNELELWTEGAGGSDDLVYEIEQDGQIYFAQRVGIRDSSPSAVLDVGNLAGVPVAIFDTENGDSDFYITRSGGTNESLNIYVSDSYAHLESIQDENGGDYGGMIFKIDNDATSSPAFKFQGKSGTEYMKINETGVVEIPTALTLNTTWNGLLRADSGVVSTTTAGAGDFLADGSVPMTADFNLDGNNIDNGGVIFLKEQADADADIAGQGQIWVNTATPNELWWTDDAGTDVQLGAAGSTPTVITVADESADTSCYVGYFTAPTGDLGPKTGTNLTFNSNTGILTATGFAGALTGNVTGDVTGSSGSCTGLAASATVLATARTIGGVNFDGSANIVPNTITVADTTDTTSFVALWESATGDLAPKTDLGITYNAGTGMLTATGLTGPLTGNADTCTTAAAGDAAVDFFGAGVDAVTDATTCTDIEGTNLSITGGVLNAVDTNTTYLGGTNLTLVDTTFNVDDAFLKNNANDTMVGVLTADGLTLGANENITLGSNTLDHDGTDFVFNDTIAVSNDSISAAELNEGDTFTWTGTTHSFSGVTNLTIPAVANAASEIAIDTTNDDQFIYYGDEANVITAYHEKCFTIENASTTDDNVPIWSPHRAITITDVYCRTQGGTSTAITISDGTNALEEVVCVAAGAADDGTIANGAFVANERMEFDIGAVVGDVDWLNVCLTFKHTAD